MFKCSYCSEFSEGAKWGICSQPGLCTFCSKCKLFFKQPKASAKERSKSCKPDKCFNKRCKIVHSLSYSVSVPPASVGTSAVLTTTSSNNVAPSYHKQGSNLSKGQILHLGPLRRNSRQVHKVSPLERPALSSLVVTPVPFALHETCFSRECRF